MARKIGKRDGSTFYDKSKNKYIAHYYTSLADTKGKRKSFDTQEEAENFLACNNYQKSNDLYIKHNGIPLNQLMRANLQKKLDRNDIEEAQYARVLKTIQVIEKSPITHKRIEDLTSEEIQDYLNTLKDYSNSYIKKIFEQFTQAYKYAMEKGYLSRNPLIEVKKPRSNKEDKEVRALEVEEQQIFTDYIMSKTIKEEPYKNIFLIQMYLGLRVGEVCALKNTDIDLQRNLINVNRTLTTDKSGKLVVGDRTKTYAGKRQVPIPHFIRNSLIEQMRIAETRENKLLFLSSNGNLIDSRNVNSILKRRLKKLGIEGISSHSLRHTYGTRCVEAGMRAVALQRLMGHKDISVTLNTYTSVFNKYKEEELEKVNDYYMRNNFISNNELLDQKKNEGEIEFE